MNRIASVTQPTPARRATPLLWCMAENSWITDAAASESPRVGESRTTPVKAKARFLTANNGPSPAPVFEIQSFLRFVPMIGRWAGADHSKRYRIMHVLGGSDVVSFTQFAQHHVRIEAAESGQRTSVSGTKGDARGPRGEHHAHRGHHGHRTHQSHHGHHAHPHALRSEILFDGAGFGRFSRNVSSLIG